MANESAAQTSVSFERAHRELLADPTLQFSFEQRETPKPPPDWLEPLVEFLRAPRKRPLERYAQVADGDADE